MVGDTGTTATRGTTAPRGTAADQADRDDPAPFALTAEQVAGYLADHPEFLEQHAELLARLTRPVDRGDGVIDLQSFMIQRLRKETERLRETQRAIIGASRANQNSQQRIHAAILFLLDARSFEQMIQTVTTDLAVLLDVDTITLLIEAAGPERLGPSAAGITVVAPGKIAGWLGGLGPTETGSIRLQSDIAGDPEIYGGMAPLVRSQALMQLNISSQTPPCMIAMGSREPDSFEDGMRTDLIAFLARVLERSIRGWLDLPV